MTTATPTTGPSEGETSPLWCMHIIGPDELHAAPDHWTALAWAAELNEVIAAKAIKEGWASDENWPLTQAVVVQWQGSASEHAECLAKELGERAAHKARRDAAATPAQPQDAAPALGGDVRDGGAFAEWSTADLAGQCRMQAREMLDPELSRFLIATADRLRTLAAASAAPPADGGTEAIAAWFQERVVAAERDRDAHPTGSANSTFYDGQIIAYDNAGSFVLRAISSRTPAGAAGDLVGYVTRQWAWSKETFGPALRTKGIVQHITKELREIEAKPHDLSEWVDVIILAMDGFWRHGGKPEDLLPAMQAKQDKNFARDWPDWRTMGEDQAIEHDRSDEPTRPASPAPAASPGGTPASAGEEGVPTGFARLVTNLIHEAFDGVDQVPPHVEAAIERMELALVGLVNADREASATMEAGAMRLVAEALEHWSATFPKSHAIQCWLKQAIGALNFARKREAALARPAVPAEDVPAEPKNADEWPKVYGGWARGFAEDEYDTTRRGLHLKHKDGTKQSIREDEFIRAYPDHSKTKFIKAEISGDLRFHSISPGQANAILASRPTEPGGARGWPKPQPISTAPRDGTWFLSEHGGKVILASRDEGTAYPWDIARIPTSPDTAVRDDELKVWWPLPAARPASNDTEGAQ